jgi:hypothetical protein
MLSTCAVRSAVLGWELDPRIIVKAKACEAGYGHGHLREGAWINARTGECRFIDEHGDWAKQPGNLASIGLPDAVQEAMGDIPND